VKGAVRFTEGRHKIIRFGKGHGNRVQYSIGNSGVRRVLR
jgi:hypothetical protein